MNNNTTWNLKLAVDALMEAIEHEDESLKTVKVLKNGYIHFILANGAFYEWDGLDLMEMD